MYFDRNNSNKTPTWKKVLAVSFAGLALIGVYHSATYENGVEKPIVNMHAGYHMKYRGKWPNCENIVCRDEDFGDMAEECTAYGQYCDGFSYDGKNGCLKTNCKASNEGWKGYGS